MNFHSITRDIYHIELLLHIPVRTLLNHCQANREYFLICRNPKFGVSHIPQLSTYFGIYSGQMYFFLLEVAEE